MDLGQVLRALGDDRRRRVVAELAVDPSGAERACGSFDLPLSKATRTHHFRVLREAGLTVHREHGNGSAVTLRRDEIEKALPGLLELLADEYRRRTAGA
ncbi:ArsR family transcriptional regulator [Actinomadura sp. CNU-125]|uniref:ArsR/SmtB family transcription factor n=1 Tax=Actinomadura sp. CNU-125 TaxID=1904961 RepID=UPI00095D4F53|nr:helix-turn-helix domain-containing protein [Actinomadura sp. CNU-125]OLT26831.1 ArsR family transcriptional regulator [Actinomadura sp. CNU-125]